MTLRVSHAQNREDIVIAGFFPDVTNGHYVDIGAGHPSDLSVTKLFYDQGWSGINIEPIPELAKLLRAERPRDVTLELGVLAEVGAVTLRQYAGSGLSSVNPEVIARHATTPTKATTEFEELEIEATTLATLLREHPLDHIHFMKIDVEGSEYDVLAGNDWDAFRPELLCIETDHMVRDWTPLLADARYRRVFHDGLNAYFLAEEAAHRAEHFSFSGTVLDGGPIVGADIAAEVQAAPLLRAQIEALEKERARITAELTAAEQARLRLENALVAETSLRVRREEALTAQLVEQGDFLASIIGSTSWRVTKPIRQLSEFIRARFSGRPTLELVASAGDDAEAQPPAAIAVATVSPEGEQVLEELQLLAELKDGS